ncbi:MULTISPECIES: ATP-binding protein [Streptomyces]|uniref:AAA family ATPase n=3 Tax=Streptomyces rimosus TaxID=1927 RepID=L8F0V7_STRR1|nr:MULTISPECIES: ATP-binding protein [Streptomyces]KOG73119.1 ATP/GTP-binding protein [Kitasatospora aureofaciens]MYT42019.1 AAA family ATPase [Streptomyces sp. SID5471]KEF04893.1 ATP/GTP-binding protein [Streptomyces rimosus]KEF11500.1 ATP/GTP-binding protein [Streptomyces rimosus]KOT38666.1 ATP/GTP-binding protein [Streptomyces rimosus subsp. rimosus]
MKRTSLGPLQPLDTTIPDPALIVLIGAAGSGKSTWASTWPSTQVLELDQFRAMVSDDAGDQTATVSAAAVLHSVLEARLARKRTTVIDATNTEAHVRAGLLDVARSYGVPAVAFLVSTPADVCVQRQASRSPARAVPADVVRRQHAEAAAAAPHLHDEGFAHVLCADRTHRLELLLRRVSGTRRQRPGWDGGGSLLGLRAVHRFFGSEVVPLWRWHVGSHLAGGDHVGEIRLGPDRLVFALRSDVGGSFGFDLLVACPVDDDCDAPAWEPVYSVTDLLVAQTSATVCTVHGGPDRTGHRQGGDHACEGEAHALVKFRSA